MIALNTFLAAATLLLFVAWARHLHRTSQPREPRQPGRHSAAGLAIHDDPTYTPADVTA